MEKRLAHFSAGLRNNTKFSDAEICVGNNKIPVHRSVVCAMSDFFNKAFTGGFKEDEKRSLKIEHASMPAMVIVIDFAYCIDVENALQKSCFDVVCEVVALSDRFQANELTSIAASVAASKVTPSNCIQLCKLLNTYNLP